MGFSVTPELEGLLDHLLDPEHVTLCRSCLDWSIANPGPLFAKPLAGTKNGHRIALREGDPFRDPGFVRLR